jgi:tRNA pseudouridine38-40 synthase
MRLALCLEYDGSAFHGWQSQPDGKTVQDVLELALSNVSGEPIKTFAAGRTDAGVHALAQIVHFDSDAERPLSAWIRGTNAHLPAAVAVRWAQPVADSFHARFSASARRYRYVLLNNAVRPALLNGKVGWYHAPLDANAMNEAARNLLGEHDFSAFRAAQCQARTPVKTLHSVSVVRQGDYLLCDFRANAFLHHMVRNIVGALVTVGKGAQPPDWIAALLADRDRTRAAPTFSGAGLYFAGAEYPADWRLPEEGRIIAPLSSQPI